MNRAYHTPEIHFGLMDANGGLWLDGRLICTGTPRDDPTAAPTPLQALRARLEAHVEQMIALLDTLDGDPDLELTCEDEGAQCEDEGVDSDAEPDWEGDISWAEWGNQRRVSAA